MAGVSFDADRHGELFSAYLDGELKADEVAEVSDILDRDHDAVSEFRSLRDGRRSVRLLPQLQVPASLLPDGHLGDGLSAYLDGELASREHQRITLHLVDCAECRVDLQELDRARIAVRSLPGVEATITAETPTTAPRRRRRLVAGGIGVAAAAALFLGFVFGGGGEPALTLDDLATRHLARASAEPAFSVLPAGVEVAAP